MAQLLSELFGGDPVFEACAVRDEAHIVPGSRGPHVTKIQHALAGIDGARFDPMELNTGHYGPTTTAGVLAYKIRCGIINRAYQTQADNIVGKMTIARLDADMLIVERRLRAASAFGR